MLLNFDVSFSGGLMVRYTYYEHGLIVLKSVQTRLEVIKSQLTFDQHFPFIFNTINTEPTFQPESDSNKVGKVATPHHIPAPLEAWENNNFGKQ